MATTNSYLKRNRLADVIALIQVLGLDEHTHRSLNGLTSELQGPPKSGGTWITIAEQHPEFFRFNRQKHDKEGAEAHTISLAGRHVIKENAEGIRELPVDFIMKLIDTAIELHDKQKERADWWKAWLPFIAVIITVLGSIYVNHQGAVNKATKQLAPDTVIIKYLKPADTLGNGK